MLRRHDIVPVADAHLRTRLEEALNDHDGQSCVRTAVIRCQTGQAVEIDRIDHHGGRQIAQIRFRPEAAVAADLRNGRNICGIDAAAKGHGQLTDHEAVRAEADLQRAEALRQVIHFIELLIADRLGRLVIADAVHSAQGVADKGVVGDEQILILCVCPAADRAAAGDGLVDLNDRAAADDPLALSRDSPDVLAAFHAAHGIAAGDDGFGLSRDSAAIVAARGDVSVVFTARDHAQLRQPADSAVVVLLCRDRTVVDALAHDAARKVGIR